MCVSKPWSSLCIIPDWGLSEKKGAQWWSCWVSPEPQPCIRHHHLPWSLHPKMPVGCICRGGHLNIQSRKKCWTVSLRIWGMAVRIWGVVLNTPCKLTCSVAAIEKNYRIYLEGQTHWPCHRINCCLAKWCCIRASKNAKGKHKTDVLRSCQLPSSSCCQE